MFCNFNHYKDTQDIQILQKTFHEMMNNNRQIQVKSFIETKLTLMKLIYLRIVSVQSAGTYIYKSKCSIQNTKIYVYLFIFILLHTYILYT